MRAKARDRVIGTSASEICVFRKRTEVPIELNRGRLDRCIRGLSNESDRRLYLSFDGIRGTQDAATLTVSIRHAPLASDADGGDFVAGTLALYGLRRASAHRSGETAKGLTSVLDVTPSFRALTPEARSQLHEVLVSIHLGRELPSSAAIAIGSISLVCDEVDLASGR